MSTKWLGEGTGNKLDHIGEKLVATYIHAGNTEYHMSSVDWANGIITCTQPHGIAVGATVAVGMAPNYQDMSNLTRDLKTMPIEWMKPQGITVSTPIGLKLLGVDATTAKVVKGSDGTTVLTVNTTATENPTIDCTAFHFEAMTVPFAIDNLPLLKKFKLRFLGYTMLYSANANYRYTQVVGLNDDGTPLSVSYLGITGISQLGNPYNGAGMLYRSEWIIDATAQQVSYEWRSYTWGRRNGYANQVDMTQCDGPNGGSNLQYISASKTIRGVTRVQSYANNTSYAYFMNGLRVDVIDLGGRGE